MQSHSIGAHWTRRLCKRSNDNYGSDTQRRHDRVGLSRSFRCVSRGCRGRGGRRGRFRSLLGSTLGCRPVSCQLLAEFQELFELEAEAACVESLPAAVQAVKVARGLDSLDVSHNLRPPLSASLGLQHFCQVFAGNTRRRQGYACFGRARLGAVVRRGFGQDRAHSRATLFQALWGSDSCDGTISCLS
ncbi:hypothetical protein H310_00288 [Aphanomyces invadans]|uniref:Uncharacterized protein n=1 Tax=Aphanomyces invadans TaxID=157072 RepID=A0A024UV28_9STRA|nr:hypothetical protein H310_00288 [Aphanomyces invadans]ETW09810.1 hypothetical protein H310_00288 [Aphanomyces invadans]|eukprot:XP_008861221.1 hypothetical protein H310_00288 [Aphanomyces invadans]